MTQTPTERLSKAVVSPGEAAAFAQGPEGPEGGLRRRRSCCGERQPARIHRLEASVA